MSTTSDVRTYDPTKCAVFCKTGERFGGLSNMAGGFSLYVNGTDILTSEALYQACRFPHLPGIQRLIIEQRSPMTAKMKSKPYRDQSRPDWDAVRVRVMRWCLRVKLAQNWVPFGDLLQQTENLPIVEYSRKDEFWGAKPYEDGRLVGMNVLGRLLMELREQLKRATGDDLKRVEPIPISDFLLDGVPIRVVQPRSPTVVQLIDPDLFPPQEAIWANTNPAPLPVVAVPIVEPITSQPPVLTPVTRGGQPSEPVSVYHRCLPLVLELLGIEEPEEQQLAGIARKLDVLVGQLKKWVRRAIKEGVISKRPKAGKMVLSPAPLKPERTLFDGDHDAA